jgi:hypothetical protein
VILGPFPERVNDLGTTGHGDPEELVDRRWSLR